MTKHTTQTEDGTRIDIEKKNPGWKTLELEVQVLGTNDDDEEVVKEVTTRLGHCVDGDVDGTRDATVDVLAEAVASVLDSVGIDTSRLVRARVEETRTVRDIYGPQRDHYDWLDADPEDFDRAAEERSARSREALEQ